MVGKREAETPQPRAHSAEKIRLRTGQITMAYAEPELMPDMVNHPPHYTSDPSGVECITITRHRSFNVGNAIKYLWRAGLKRDAATSDRVKQVEDLRKAVFYIEDEIRLLEGAHG